MARLVRSVRSKTPASEPAPHPRVKMSVLAKMSGVPAATIKHYVNAGLLPEPTRTGRNMAYYDVDLVGRVQRIKELQRTRFLPLKVIRDVLDESQHDDPDETVAATIARVLRKGGERERRTRAELQRSGLPKAQLDWLVRSGLVRSKKEGANEIFEGEDLELLRLLGAARKAGLDPEMLPLEVLAEYAQALGALVRAELQLFRQGVLPRAGANLPELTEAATELSEKLVLLLRRKMLLPTLEALVRDSRAAQAKKT
jgi:DNA-binding transcriptional MerR regulator